MFTNKYNNSAPISEKTQSASIPKTNRLLRFRETISVCEIYVSNNGVDKVVSFLGYDVVSDISEEFAANIFRRLSISRSYSIVQNLIIKAGHIIIEISGELCALIF